MLTDEGAGPWVGYIRRDTTMEYRRRVVNYTQLVKSTAPRRPVIATITGLLGVINSITDRDLRVCVVVEEVAREGSPQFDEAKAEAEDRVGDSGVG